MSERPPIQIGDQYWNWTVIAKSHPTSRGETQWLIRCQCGHERVICTGSLRAGRSKRCMSCAGKKRVHERVRLYGPQGRHALYGLLKRDDG